MYNLQGACLDMNYIIERDVKPPTLTSESVDFGTIDASLATPCHVYLVNCYKFPQEISECSIMFLLQSVKEFNKQL